MPNWVEGDRVRVITRAVTEEDRKKNRYFDHMAGQVGTVQNVYDPAEVVVRVDRESMGPITLEVQETATQRMRDKFLGGLSEEQKKTLTKEELEFDAHYVLLVRSEDLEKI